MWTTLLTSSSLSWLLVLRVVVLPRTSMALNNGLAQTPPMGFNSYMAGPECQHERGLHAVADFIVSTGLAELGYVYINTDEGWELTHRDPTNGQLQWNQLLYPSGLPTFIETLHNRSLQFGIYGASSGVTCGERPGQLYYEIQDAQTFADWGVDFLKSDNCASYAIDSSVRFAAMAAALNHTKRHVVFSIEPFTITPDPAQSIHVSHMWRVGCDIEATVPVILNRADIADKWAPLAGPGGWNDPDMIHVQNPPALTLGENRIYFGLWAIMKAPLLLSANLMQLESSVLNIIKNKELIDINQDPLGYQARKLTIDGFPVPWNVGVEDCSVPVELHLKHFRTGQGHELREVRTWNVIAAQEYYQIQNVATGRCLTVLQKKRVVLLPCLVNSNDQHWSFDMGISTVTGIRSVSAGLNLAISNSTLYSSTHGHDTWNVSDSAYGHSGLVLITPIRPGECTIRDCQEYDPTQMWFYSRHDGLLRHALYTSSINHQPTEGDGYTLTNKVPTFRHHCLAHVLSDGNIGTDHGTIEAWGGKLAGGEYILGLLNRGVNNTFISVSFSALLELDQTSVDGGGRSRSSPSTFWIRDVWDGTDAGSATGAFEAMVPGMDIGIYRLSPSQPSTEQKVQRE